MELNKIHLDSDFSNTIVPSGQRFLFLGYLDGDQSTNEIVIRYKDSNGKYGNISSGYSNIEQQTEINSIENGFIVLKNTAIPVFIKTSIGNIYPIEKDTIKQVGEDFYIEVEPYLAYDNIVEFSGTWTVYYGGGSKGEKGETGKLTIVISDNEPSNPVEGMIWVPTL